MRRLVIEVPEPGDPEENRCGFDVVDSDGRRCGGLGFDEMLGQIVSLCHPKLGRPHYRMRTQDEWEAERARRLQSHLKPDHFEDAP